MNQAKQHHLDFAPPSTPGLVRSMALALLAHLALLAILAAGVAWKRETPVLSAQAELWAAVPVEAAPLPTEQPEPTPTPEPKPQPEPPPPETPPPPKVEAPAPPKAVDIVLAKEKERLRKEKELKDAQLAQKEAQRKDELAQEKKRLEKERQAKLAKAQQAERDKAQQAAEQAKKDAAAKQAKVDAKRTEEMRAQQLKRMAALAGAPPANTGSGGNGNAAKSAGPGTSYFGLVASRIKPNITYTDIISSNPTTEIEVSLSPTGNIQSRRIVKRSGNNAWDNAALNAIDKTEKLPLDNGKVWSPLVIVLSPQTLLGP
jgi:colicin import membrane protein